MKKTIKTSMLVAMTCSAMAQSVIAQTLQESITKLQENATAIESVVNGPATGVGSSVALPGGGTQDTLAKMSLQFDPNTGLRIDQSQTLTVAQKTQLAANWPEAVDTIFYDTFSRVGTPVGSVGVPDKGGVYTISGNGAVGLTVANGAVKTTGSGACYMGQSGANYLTMGGKAIFERLSGSGESPLVLIASPTPVLDDKMIHALIDRNGVVVHVIPTGGAGALGNTPAIYARTSADGQLFHQTGDTINFSFSVYGQNLVIRHPSIPGGSVTVSSPDVATVAGDGFCPIFEVIGNGGVSGSQNGWDAVWASSNPDYVSGLAQHGPFSGTRSDGTRVISADFGEDETNQAVEFPGPIFTYSGDAVIPSELIDGFGLNNAIQSGGEVFYERNSNNVRDLEHVGDQMEFEVWGRIADPDGTESIQWDAANANITFTPPDGGNLNLYVGFHFKWIIKRRDAAINSYLIVCTGSCGDETKTVASVTNNFSGTGVNTPKVTASSTSWAFYAANVTRRK